MVRLGPRRSAAPGQSREGSGRLRLAGVGVHPLGVRRFRLHLRLDAVNAGFGQPRRPISIPEVIIHRVTGPRLRVVEPLHLAGADGLVLVVEADPSGIPPNRSHYYVELIDPTLDPGGRIALFSLSGAAVVEFTDWVPKQVDEVTAPAISYMARDYESFRRTMLDHLALSVPSWSETHAADVGVTLVELLAYAADYLAYQQDAVATEAYLDTCLHRVSAARHAALLDYRASEGCNARTWIAAEVTTPVTLVRSTRLATDVGSPGVLVDDEAAVNAGALFFETLDVASFDPRHNAIPIQAPGRGTFTVPAGATSLDLTGDYPDLAAGMAVVLEQLGEPAPGALAPRTGAHVVRLVQPPRSLSSPEGEDVVTRIEWGAEDALPFPLTVAEVTASGSRA